MEVNATKLREQLFHWPMRRSLLEKLTCVMLISVDYNPVTIACPRFCKAPGEVRLTFYLISLSRRVLAARNACEEKRMARIAAVRV